MESQPMASMKRISILLIVRNQMCRFCWLQRWRQIWNESKPAQIQQKVSKRQWNKQKHPLKPWIVRCFHAWRNSLHSGPHHVLSSKIKVARSRRHKSSKKGKFALNCGVNVTRAKRNDVKLFCFHASIWKSLPRPRPAPRLAVCLICVWK